MKTGYRQAGLTTVEFAIVGLLLFVVLFGVIEVGRALFVWNTIAEATRRGARMAVVCPVNDPKIARAAIFADPSSGATSSPVLPGLKTANISVVYLDENGAQTAVFANIRYVRVSVVNFQFKWNIPLHTATVNVPAFQTTLPIESLGWDPSANTRQC